jgi:hypothetical protein
MADAPSTHLSPDQRRQFEENGYFFPIPVLDDRERKHYLDRSFEFHHTHRVRIEKILPKERYLVFSELHFVLRWMHKIIMRPPILDALQSVLRPDLVVH